MMSSRSIGVTNVWFSRLKMSCVTRSPSCSQSRMSRASDARSGNDASISSSISAGPDDVLRGLLEEVEELAVLRHEDL